MRACPSASPAPTRPGTYAVEPRFGTPPEAYLAFPFARADEGERAAAMLVAAALTGDGGLLEKALSAPGPARSSSARVIGWPEAPALVVRIESTQADLDAAVMQARVLFDRLKRSGLAVAEHARALANLTREAVAAALDPRMRVVATWRGEPIATATIPLPRGRANSDDVRACASKRLGEESLVVVASRPGLSPAAGVK